MVVAMQNVRINLVLKIDLHLLAMMKELPLLYNWSKKEQIFVLENFQKSVRNKKNLQKFKVNDEINKSILYMHGNYFAISAAYR